MKRLQKGFTLIELMIVVAIVGILAAIALPAYQDYVIRSKMSEGVAALAACKTSVSEFVSSRSAWPTDENQAGCSTLTTGYVKSLTVSNAGSITVTTWNTGSQLGGAAGDCDMQLVPQGNPPQITSWTGTNGGLCDVKYLPSTFR